MSTPIIKNVVSILEKMDSIDLEGMSHVRLMRRRDTKYVVEGDKLPTILDQIKDDYKVMEIENQRIQPYKTVYFDTPELAMYFDHHNQRKNRYKVRMRKYMLSGQSFLEIKFKNNRGETIKKRVDATMDVDSLDPEKAQFLADNSPFHFSDIEPALWNSFSRITLVSKYRPERLTIDLGLEFSMESHEQGKPLHKACVIEVKRDLDAEGVSDVISVLKKNHIKATGFSKYCMGTVLTKIGVRHNLFKQRLRTLGLYMNN